MEAAAGELRSFSGSEASPGSDRAAASSSQGNERTETSEAATASQGSELGQSDEMHHPRGFSATERAPLRTSSQQLPLVSFASL